MNVAGFVRTVLLKPVVLILLLVVGTGAGVVGWNSATTHYESTGSVLVIPPGAGATDPGKNPFANLGEGIAQLANVVALAAQAPEAQERVAATGAQTGYTVSTMAGDSSRSTQLSPQITFVVSGPDAETAQRGARELITVMRDKLRRLQVDAGVTVPGTFADLRVSVEPPLGAEIPAASARDAASYAMGAVGLVTVLILVAVSAKQLIRRRPSHGEVAPAPVSTSGPQDGDRAGENSVADEGVGAQATFPITEAPPRPPRPRQIAPTERPLRPQRALSEDWATAEEPLPEPPGDDRTPVRSSRRVPPQVRWARPANRDDPARPRA